MKKYKQHIILFAGAIFCSFLAMGQEDLVSTEEILVEQQSINFQTFFFEALQQKAIGNHDKAIFALEACNNIDKENTAVLFELSKNYAMLIKYTEAEYYILKALERDPGNIYMLRHYKKIKTNQNDYLGAIKVQDRIITLKPEEEADLVLLYIKAGEIEKATQLLKKLDDLNKLPKGLEALKESLLQEYSASDNRVSQQRAEELPKSKVDQLREAYSLDKDYEKLKVLLEKEWKSNQFLDLLKDSEEGLSTFPAQPFLYLMNGRAYNNLRKHKDATLVLLEGVDYVIDDDKLKALFFNELSLSYKAMGQNKLATDFYKQAQELMGE